MYLRQQMRNSPWEGSNLVHIVVGKEWITVPIAVAEAQRDIIAQVLIHLEIFVADSEQLSAVMRRLHQISGVMKVDRPAG